MTLRLDCHSNSSVSITYKWYFNNDLMHTGEERHYFLSNIYRQHTGNYSCVTVNHLAEKISKIQYVRVQCNYVYYLIIFSENVSILLSLLKPIVVYCFNWVYCFYNLFLPSFVAKSAK